MFDFLFDCSAFEISTTTQAINNILFPVVLFVVVFWLMCDIFLIDVAVNDNLLMVDEVSTLGAVKALIDEDAIFQETESNRPSKTCFLIRRQLSMSTKQKPNCLILIENVKISKLWVCVNYDIFAKIVKSRVTVLSITNEE